MSDKTVVKPRIAKKPQRVQETAPGDIIELSITEEVRYKNESRWVKVGLASAHRPDETSAQAVLRVQNFVTVGLDALIESTK